MHPENKYGDDVVPAHVRDLVESFSTEGFSPPEIGVPLASEVLSSMASR